MNNLFIELPTPTNSKFQYEFQELCTELQPTYGRLVWTLPYKFNEHNIRKAHEICKRRNILTYRYLYGILKKL